MRYSSGRNLCVQSIPGREKRTLSVICRLPGSISPAVQTFLRLSRLWPFPACFWAVCLLYFHPLIDYVDMLFICRIGLESSGIASGTRP